MTTIPIIIEDDKPVSRGDKTGPTRASTLSASASAISRGLSGKTKNVDVDGLSNSMTKISSSLGDILKHVTKVDKFRLKEAEVQLAVNAEGGFALIGKAGVKGAITLKFAVEDDCQ